MLRSARTAAGGDAGRGRGAPTPPACDPAALSTARIRAYARARSRRAGGPGCLPRAAHPGVTPAFRAGRDLCPGAMASPPSLDAPLRPTCRPRAVRPLAHAFRTACRAPLHDTRRYHWQLRMARCRRQRTVGSLAVATELRFESHATPCCCALPLDEARCAATSPGASSARRDRCTRPPAWSPSGSPLRRIVLDAAGRAPRSGGGRAGATDAGASRAEVLPWSGGLRQWRARVASGARGSESACPTSGRRADDRAGRVLRRVHGMSRLDRSAQEQLARPCARCSGRCSRARRARTPRIGVPRLNARSIRHRATRAASPVLAVICRSCSLAVRRDRRGRVPRAHLLSPAPAAQVTTDLRSFWYRTWRTCAAR